MYLLESDHVWSANLLSSLVNAGVVLGGLIFFLKKWISENDKKHAEHDKRIDELEDNYLDRFEKVHHQLDDNKNVLVNKIDEINRDKWEHRNRQAEQLGAIRSDVSHLTEIIKERKL